MRILRLFRSQGDRLSSLLSSTMNIHSNISMGSSMAQPNTDDMDRKGSPFTAITLAFLDDLYGVIRDEALVQGTDRKSPVIVFEQPAALEKLIDLTVTSHSMDHDSLLKACKDVIRYSVRTAHPMFMNQLYNGRDVYSFAASILVEALNTNQHSFEVAPVFMIVEKYVVQRLNAVVGFDDGDGIFLPGGNIGNMMAVHLARFRHNRAVKETGHFGQEKRQVIFTSEQAHYSFKTAAHFLGFGTDSLVTVATDDMGRMMADDLEDKINVCKSKGEEPLLVAATSATTVMGAFDPLDDLSDVCERHDLWLHVDAALGGVVLFSDKHNHLMKGIERADSLIWNAHKMLSVQLQCTAFLVKHKNLMQECNNTNAEYLYQKDKSYDETYDIGDKTITCGRKADAFKLWLMLKARGMDGIENIVDGYFEKTNYFIEKVKGRDGFRMVIPELEFLLVCFWYIPPRLRNKEETDEWWQEVAKVAPTIKDRMMKAGSMMIGYCPLSPKGAVNFFRVVISNEQMGQRDLDFILDEIERLGKDL